MAQQAIVIGSNLVIAPAGLPVTTSVAIQLGLTQAGAASGPTITAASTFNWPTAGAVLASVQGAPSVQPGQVAMWVNAAAAGNINYPS